MATKSHMNKHYYSNNYPTASKSSDVPYLWYPMMVKDETFRNVLAVRWSAIRAELSAYAEEIKTTGQKLAVSWEYNNSIWPAYHATNKRSEANGSTIAWRGDENMTDWEDIYTNMYDVYMERLRGMDTFVNDNDGSWPTWTISRKTL
jgi:hypothetical protein